MTRVGFLGTGKIAQALAKGFLKNNLLQPENIIGSCSPSDTVNAAAFRALGAKFTCNNVEVVQNSDITLLSVKPNIVPIVLKEIKDHVTSDNLLISVAMGITLQTLENILQTRCKVIRMMPNTPAVVQEGTTVFVPGVGVTDNDIETVMKLFKSVGSCERLPAEYLLDVATAINGSGPAYVYLIIEAMVDGAVRMGMSGDVATRLVSQTILGASKMVLVSGEHPARLKNDVTSPAGSTAEALFTLETKGIRGALMKAIEEATKKCIETSSLSPPQSNYR